MMHGICNNCGYTSWLIDEKNHICYHCINGEIRNTKDDKWVWLGLSIFFSIIIYICLTKI